MMFNICEWTILDTGRLVIGISDKIGELFMALDSLRRDWSQNKGAVLYVMDKMMFQRDYDVML